MYETRVIIYNKGVVTHGISNVNNARMYSHGNYWIYSVLWQKKMKQEKNSRVRSYENLNGKEDDKAHDRIYILDNSFGDHHDCARSKIGDQRNRRSIYNNIHINYHSNICDVNDCSRSSSSIIERGFMPLLFLCNRLRQ